MALRSAFLGWCSAVGASFALSTEDQVIPCFGIYVWILANFHFSEFIFTTAISANDDVNLDAFLLNHSAEYGIAALCSVLEYTIEAAFYPSEYCCMKIEYFFT